MLHQNKLKFGDTKVFLHHKVGWLAPTVIPMQ